MALTFIGETEFVQSGQPQWQQSLWDLDNLTIPFSGAEPNLNSFLDDLVISQPSDIDPDMLLVDWRVGGSKAYPSVDLVYLGKKNGILPPVRHDYNTAVMSASSSKTSDGTLLTVPATIEYYAPTSTISYITANRPGTLAAPSPVSDPVGITFTLGDTTFSLGGTIQSLINRLFIVEEKQTAKANEIVPERYYQNESTTTKILSPWVFDLPAGAFLSLYNAGQGYQVGNTLTVSSGGESATLTVTSVYVAWGDPDQAGIYSWTVTSNTFTANHTALPASGGSGTGAAFNVFIIA